MTLQKKEKEIELHDRNTIVTDLREQSGNGGSVPRPRRHRIVVADHDAGMREVLVVLLSRYYDISGAVVNGRELVEATRDLKPDLVVVDIGMPELNGFDAVQQMRTDGVDTRVVFFTGNESPLYLKKAFSLGAAGYVLRDRCFEDLSLALEAVLRGGTFVSPGLAMNR